MLAKEEKKQVRYEEIALPPSLFKSPKEAGDFVCSICTDIPNPHTATEHIGCGHLFCRSCLGTWTSENEVCPVCKQTTLEQTRGVEETNKIVYRFLCQLEVRCPTTAFDKSDCAWSGTWGSLADHLKFCPHVIADCSNGCGFKCRRKDLKPHQDAMCPMREVPCKFCSAGIKQKDTESHTAKCRENPAASVECKYAYLGCEFAGMKLEREIHESGEDKKHLELAVKYISQEQKEKGQQKKKQEEEKKQRQNAYTAYKVEVHEHLLCLCQDDNGWRCDGADQLGGCKSGVNRFGQTSGMRRYRCELCEYDLCGRCFDAYVVENSQSNAD